MLDFNELEKLIDCQSVETFQQKLKRFVLLETAKRDIETMLAKCKDAISSLGNILIEEFAEHGILRTTIGEMTVYVRTDRFVNKQSNITQEEMCEILKRNGLQNIVTEGYNAQRLKSWIIERLEEGEEVPSDIANVVKISEVQRLVAVKN